MLTEGTVSHVFQEEELDSTVHTFPFLGLWAVLKNSPQCRWSWNGECPHVKASAHLEDPAARIFQVVQNLPPELLVC